MTGKWWQPTYAMRLMASCTVLSVHTHAQEGESNGTMSDAAGVARGGRSASATLPRKSDCVRNPSARPLPSRTATAVTLWACMSCKASSAEAVSGTQYSTCKADGQQAASGMEGSPRVAATARTRDGRHVTHLSIWPARRDDFANALDGRWRGSQHSRRNFLGPRKQHVVDSVHAHLVCCN